MRKLDQERFSDFSEVTQQVTDLIWSPSGDPSGLRIGRLESCELGSMEEFSSEVEQEERGPLRTYPFTTGAVGVCSLGMSECEVLVFSAQHVW